MANTILEQISEIDLTDPEDARVLMPEQGADILAHFGEDHFLERYQRYKAHIAEWREQYPKLAEVDLRYDQQVVLEMTPGAGGQTAVNAGDSKTGSSVPAKPSETAEPAKPSAGTPLELPATAHAVPRRAVPAITAREHTEAAHTAPVHSETTHTAPSHTVPAHTTPAHKTPPSHAVTAKPAKVHSRAGAKTAEKTKSAASSRTAKARAEKIKREMIKQQKRAEAKRAALKRSRQKAAAKSHPATLAGQSR